MATAGMRSRKWERESGSLKRLLLGALFVTTLLAILYIAAAVGRRIEAGQEIAWVPMVTQRLLDWWSLLPFVPVAYLLGLRFPLSRRAGIGPVLAHAGAGLAMEAAHSTLLWNLLRLRAALGLAPLDLDQGIETTPWLLVVRAEGGMLAYGLIVAIASIEHARRIGAAERSRADRAGSRLKTAQLTSLLHQLRPHFVLNALNTVLSRMVTRPADAGAILNALAHLLESSARADRDRIPLAQELETCRAYLEIETARFQDRLGVDWDVCAPDDVLVPPFCLQLLLENAVRHGLEQTAGPFRIGVAVQTRNEDLLLSVVDSGGRLEAGGGVSGAGVALANLRARLALLYGDRASSTLSVRSGATVAEVRLPCR